MVSKKLKRLRERKAKIEKQIKAEESKSEKRIAKLQAKIDAIRKKQKS